MDGARQTDSTNLPPQGDAGRLKNPPADLLAERLEVVGGGGAGVDQEIAVLVGNHRAAAPQAAAAGFIDELPGLAACGVRVCRVGEGRAAGAGSDRLAQLGRAWGRG